MKTCCVAGCEKRRNARGYCIAHYSNAARRGEFGEAISIRRHIRGAYHNMRNRCTNPNRPDWKYYGGRGITICEEWMHSMEDFINWALKSGYKKGLTLDRTDTNGDYSPHNCRWITQKQQNWNRNDNVWIEYEGKRLLLLELPSIIGINIRILQDRYHRGDRGERLVRSVRGAV